MARTLSLIDKLATFAAQTGDPKGVLLVSAGGLGDTVLFALVLPRFMSLAREGESVTVLLRSDAAKMAFLFPPEVKVLTVDFKKLAKKISYRIEILRKLREDSYRLVISTDYLRHPNLDETLIAACGAPETAAMEPRSWPKHDQALQENRRLYGRLFDSGKAHRDKVLRWTAFAHWLNGISAPPPLVRLPEERLASAARPDPHTVLIQPFSAVKAKQSLPSLYMTLMDALPDYHFVLLGAPGDLKRNPEFGALLERGATFDPSFFEDLVPLLRGADLVISVDTALVHLATAVGAKTLCLASAAYVGEIVPYAKEITPPNVTFLYHAMPCEGCLGACIHPLERGMYPCVACLDEGRVVTTVKNLLKG